MSTGEYIKELEETIIRLIKERDNAIEKIQQLEKENEAIKKRLFFYENPHTPPSVKNLKKESAKKNKISRKKQGAPKGHRGATRKRPEPTEFVHVTAKCCPKCRHPIGKPARIETKVIEELVKPPYLIMDGRRMIPDFEDLVEKKYTYLAVGSMVMTPGEI